MSGWALSPLARIRTAQARAASREAARRWADAARLRDAGRDLAARALAERCRALAPFPFMGPAAPGDLVAHSAARAGADAGADDRATDARGATATEDPNKSCCKRLSSSLTTGALRLRR